jgi:hypothetical protein
MNIEMNRTKQAVEGIVPPMITPLLDTNTLNEKGIENLVEHLIAGGVNGIFIFGTTGEAQHLSVKVKEDKIENAHFPDEGHDYGLSKRKSMYHFVSRYFNLDIQKADESNVTIESEAQLRVFGENGEKFPENAIKGEEALAGVLKKYGIYIIK